MTDTEELLRKESLINAYKYGEAEVSIVMKKIMANYPELRSKAKEIRSILTTVISEVNSLSTEETEKIVTTKYPEDIIEEKKERDYLPEIMGAIKGKVVVRYPPEPAKHPHIGQMLSFCINHLIAERFDGKRVLRYDDTNPEKVKEEYYDSFREVILWMGLEIEDEVKASDHMERYYDKARFLISKGDAFVCQCARETFSKMRAEQKACSCNLNNSIEKNQELFDKVLEGVFGVGEAVVRLKGDMQSKNSAVRDPVLLRISSHVHCIQGDKYVLWPMYDFESAIMEDFTGVTHVLRSIEFGKMREELQQLIATKLELKVPYFLEYSRFNIIGAPTQGRLIRELVEEGVVTGWDDYRLVTYQALKRRGIQPQVFIEIIKRVGATKSTTNIDWSLISSINRKIIEPKSKHYFFVSNPVEINLSNPETKDVIIPLLPEKPEFGNRSIHVEDILYLNGDEKEFLEVGKTLRMKDLFNIKLTEKITDKKFTAEVLGEELLPNVPRLQWVSEPVQVEIIQPEMLYLNNRINKDSLRIILGYGEKNLTKLKIGEIIQLERTGYAKVNKKNDVIEMNYIHG